MHVIATLRPVVCSFGHLGFYIPYIDRNYKQFLGVKKTFQMNVPYMKLILLTWKYKGLIFILLIFLLNIRLVFLLKWYNVIVSESHAFLKLTKE